VRALVGSGETIVDLAVPVDEERDHVAAVFNKTGMVKNGERVEVIDRERRFVKVRASSGEEGWIEQRFLASEQVHQGFEKLGQQEKNDPVEANGTIRNQTNLHVTPGRETEHLYLLNEGSKVQILKRATVEKTAPGVFAKPANQTAKTAGVPMEDWWLIRDGQGRVGWLLARMVDLDVPLEIAQYAEGQRIVGAYVLARINDAQADVPNHQVPEYVTALSPPKSGLPYDFDQIRVFTWSLKRHRYETAFRIHPIQGFLPVRVWTQPAQNGNEPVFSFQLSSSPDVSIDPETGITKPVNPRTIVYAMRDTQVRRIGPDMASIPTTHLPGEKTKSGKAEKKRRK